MADMLETVTERSEPIPDLQWSYHRAVAEAVTGLKRTGTQVYGLGLGMFPMTNSP